MKNFKRFNKKSAIVLALVIALVVTIIVVGANSRSGKASNLADAAGAVAAPLQSASTSIADWLEGMYGYIFKYDELVAKNAELERQLAEAQEIARAAKEDIEENKRLKELLGLSETNKDFVYETAKIIEWSSSNWASSFTIGKGSNAGIEVGDSVITETGALCGQVAELGSSWARVRTVIDVDISIGCLVGEGGNAAMVIGDFNLMQKGFVKLYHLTEGMQPLEGDVILSSGRGGFFPQGLVIGYIEAMMTEAGGQTPYGVVRPACDYGDLAQVFIITEFEFNEQNSKTNVS